MKHLGETQRQRLDFHTIERLRWQRVIFDKTIALATFTIDPRAGRTQTVDVAIERTR